MKKRIKLLPRVFILLFTIQLSAQTTDAGSNGITKEEYESQIYCDACFNELDVIDKQKANLKAHVTAKGVTISVLKENFFKMEKIAEYWENKANEKAHFKDLPWWEKALIKLGAIALAVGGFFIGASI